jgi:hypothetical protein
VVLGKLDLYMQKIKKLQVRPGTVKPLQEKIWKALEYIGIGDDFLNRL